jgi:hypothetical protein
VIHLEQDEFLQLDVLEGIILQHYVLSDALHGIVAILFWQINQIDLPKVSSSNDTHKLEVLQVKVLIFFCPAIQGVRLLSRVSYLTVLVDSAIPPDSFISVASMDDVRVETIRWLSIGLAKSHGVGVLSLLAFNLVFLLIVHFDEIFLMDPRQFQRNPRDPLLSVLLFGSVLAEILLSLYQNNELNTAVYLIMKYHSIDGNILFKQLGVEELDGVQDRLPPEQALS